MHRKITVLLLFLTLAIASIAPSFAGGYGFPKKAEDAAAASGDDLCVQGAVIKVGNDTALAADGDYTVPTCNDVGNLKIQLEPTRKATYAASSTFTTLAASCTDFATLYGSGTKTIKVHKIFLKNRASTTAAWDTISLIKRSTAPSGGTATTLTNVPLDSANAAGTAVAKIWTANPTVGTAVGTIMTRSLNNHLNTAAGSPMADSTIYSGTLFFDSAVYGQPIVLRGTGEGACLSLGGVTQGGSSPTMDVEFVWTEEHPALVALALIGLFGAHSRRRREIDKLRRAA